MAKPAIKALGALLVLLLVVGALPARASCNCTMPPTASPCCDTPSRSCSSPDLAADHCQAVLSDDSAVLAGLHELALDSSMDEPTRTGAGTLPEPTAEARPPAPSESPQIPHIGIFQLDCSYLI